MGSSMVEFLKDLTEKGGRIVIDARRLKTRIFLSLDELEKRKRKKQVRNVIKLHPPETKSHFQRS